MKNKQKKPKRRRIDVNVEELDQIVDRARQAPLSDADYAKLKTALHALIEQLLGLKKTGEARIGFGGPNSRIASRAAASGKIGGTRTQRCAGFQRCAKGGDRASATDSG